MIGLSVASQAAQTRFTRDDNTNIVTDTQTHLQWQDQPYTQAEQDAYDDDKEEGKVLFWENAITYCESLTLGGKDDWRLPNFNELYYITDRSTSDPALSSVFKHVSSSYYWSSTTAASNTSSAWIVNFDYGSDDYNDKSYSYFVRCVRAGQ